MRTSGCRRVMSRQEASRPAGRAVRETYSEPAVVTTPWRSMLSFTARRSCGLNPGSVSLGGGQYVINVWSLGTLEVRFDGSAHPVDRIDSKSAGNIHGA